MTYSYKWLDSEKKIIKRTSSDGLITFIPLDSDNLDYQGYLEWEAIDGNNIEEISTTLTWDDIREKRNGLLISTDWTMTAGATVDQAQWAAYRQVIRDIPQTYKDKTPDDVVWPTQPSTAGPNT
jgi:hypothetical protein